jgi:nitrous oxidase accessory protein
MPGSESFGIERRTSRAGSCSPTHWSDNPSFDLNNDGIADQPYRPNDMVDQLLWKHPLSKLLINTPAMELLRWSQSEFPTVYPGGVVDSAPLMQPAVGSRPAS